MNSTTVTSSLSISIENYASLSQDAYIWCSVSVRGSSTPLFNPSLVLHVLLQSQCSQSDEWCPDDIHLYSLDSTFRCADAEDGSVDVIEAQQCSQNYQQTTDYKERDESPPTTMSNEQTIISEEEVESESFPTSNMTPSTAPPKTSTTSTNSSIATSMQPSIYVIIGSSLGGIVVLLFCIIALLFVYTIKQKMKSRVRERTITTTTPSAFDDIRMYTGTSKKTTDNDEQRASKLLCGSNICYDEFPHIPASKSIENIYEYVF